MNWQLIEDTLRQWFLQVTGLSAVIWEGQAAAFPTRPYGELHISAVRNVGEDERRTVFDATQPAGKELVRTVVGHRIFTLGCKARSRDNRPGNAALAYLEKARTSLAQLWVLDLFRSADLAFIDAEATVDLPGAFQDRAESFAAMDIHFCAVVNETDALDQGGYIDKTEIGLGLTGGGDAADAWLADQKAVAGTDTDTLIVDRKGALVKDEDGELLEAAES